MTPTPTGRTKRPRGDEELTSTREPTSGADGATKVPEPRLTLEGVAARIECPRTGDPNGASNLAFVIGHPAQGTGEATPEAALRAYLQYVWPLADPWSFAVTGRSSGQVLFENRHAALIVTMVEGGRWNVINEVFWRPVADQWRGGRP